VSLNLLGQNKEEAARLRRAASSTVLGSHNFSIAIIWKI